MPQTKPHPASQDSSLVTKNKIILAVFLFLILILCIFGYLSQRTVMNDEQETGNTAGNLNNKGLFCEQDQTVYFSNAYDHDVLYSMNPDETDVKRLTNVGVASINADSTRIFYSQTGTAEGSGLGYMRNSTGMYHCNHDGKRIFCYTKDPVGILALSGNSLYYQHHKNELGTPLVKVSIGKKNMTDILTDMVSPACVTGHFIYYAGNGDDHSLYALDTATDTSSLIWEHPVWNPIYQDGYLYYMDLESNYSLHRYDLATGEDLALTQERIDFFNVYENIIYFQTADTDFPALKRIHIDGTGEEIVMDGVFESVNITSQYAYFNEFNKPTPVYHQSTFGAINPTVFNPQTK